MTILRFIAEWALRSSVMILAGAGLLRICSVKDASLRAAAWVTMLCASLVIPVLTATAPGLPLVRAKVAPVIQAAPVVIESAAASSDAPLATTPPQPTRFAWWNLGFAMYGVVTGLLLLRLFVGLALSLRLLRASRRTGRTADGVEIRESEQVSVPVTLGITRPAILLPEDWREWDEVKLQAVVAHERAHVRRRDPLVQLVSAMHRALLWFTPLSWYLHRQIVRVAEEASDDAAVAAVLDRESYASVLLDFMGARTQRTAWEGVAMARYGSPEKRIRRILNATGVSRRVTLGTLAAMAGLAFPLAYVAAAARTQSVPVIVTTKTPAPAQVPATPAIATTNAEMPPVPVVNEPPAAAKPARRQTTQPQESVATQETTGAQESAGAIRHYVIVQGDNQMSGSWDSEMDDINDLRSRYGDRFAWFRQNGHEYVVTDANVLAELDKAMEPQKNVNRMQSDVNAEQAKVNALQSKVNAHQGDVNALQHEVNRRQDLVNQIQNAVNREDNATLIQKLEGELQQLRAGKPEANQALVNRKQAEVNQEQAGVNEEQSKVNAMQHKVNDEQHRVSQEMSRRVQEILGSSVQKGTAKEVR